MGAERICFKLPYSIKDEDASSNTIQRLDLLELIGRTMIHKLELPIVRTQKARNEFCFRTYRLVNNIPYIVNFFNLFGLKIRLLESSEFRSRHCNDNNPCTWHYACDCLQWRNSGIHITFWWEWFDSFFEKLLIFDFFSTLKAMASLVP